MEKLATKNLNRKTIDWDILPACLRALGVEQCKKPRGCSSELKKVTGPSIAEAARSKKEIHATTANVGLYGTTATYTGGTHTFTVPGKPTRTRTRMRKKKPPRRKTLTPRKAGRVKIPNKLQKFLTEMSMPEEKAEEACKKSANPFACMPASSQALLHLQTKCREESS